MPITYRIDRERRIVFTKWTGRIDAADLAAFFHAYAADAEALACGRGIQDMREAEIVFTGEDIQALASTVAIPALRKHGRATTAFVVRQAVQFGSVRQWEVFAETMVETAIFEDMDAATAWLLLKLPPAH